MSTQLEGTVQELTFLQFECAAELHQHILGSSCYHLGKVKLKIAYLPVEQVITRGSGATGSWRIPLEILHLYCALSSG